MMVAGGYPEKYEKEKKFPLKIPMKNHYFSCGTIIKNNKVVSNGGHIIAITSYGKNLETALKTSYKNVEK